MRQGYASNISRLYLIKLSKWFMLIMPIVALFYNHNGLSTQSIYLLQAVYSLSVAVFEIPSGYLADVIGRKKSLIFGSVLGTFGFVIYSYSFSFESFLVAEIILGIGGSFISGSDSALLYDSLAADKNEQKYLQYEGRITSLGSFAETFAAIGGGLIALYLGYRGVYIVQTMIAAIAIPAAITLKEPPRKKTTSRPGLKQILEISYESLFVNRKLSSTICFSSAIGTATLCMAWTSQIYFVHEGLTEKAITPLWVLLNLGAATISAYAAKTQNLLGETRALLLIVFMIPLGYVLLGTLPFYLAVFSLFLFYMVRGYATPLLKDFTNKNCDSEVRATVLSIRNMLIRTAFSIVGPAIGFMANHFSLGSALICAGIFFSICSILGHKYLIQTQAHKF